MGLQEEMCSQNIKEIFSKIFAPSAAQIKLFPCHPKVSSLHRAYKQLSETLKELLSCPGYSVVN